MTSLQIQYFLKVADCMSFSQAADELYVSQPSVSRQIQQLEHELGCALFDRSRKNAISLTPAGMVFRDSFRRQKKDGGHDQGKAKGDAHDLFDGPGVALPPILRGEHRGSRGQTEKDQGHDELYLSCQGSAGQHLGPDPF